MLNKVVKLYFKKWDEAVLTSTHTLCVVAKIRKIGIPMQTPVFFYINMGLKGVYFSWTCFPGGFLHLYRTSYL